MELTGELIEIGDGHTEQFGNAELVLQPERDDATDSATATATATDTAVAEAAAEPPDNIESSRDDPVDAQLYGFYTASLAAGESDFYEFTIPAGEAVVITAYALMSEVELAIYGTDAGFQVAPYRDTGYDTRFESVVYPEQRTIFFTVSADEPDAYELFVIEAEER